MTSSLFQFFSYPSPDYETKRKDVLVVLVPISLIASLCRSIGNWPISRQLPAIGSLNISHAFIFLFSFLSSLPTRPVPSFLSPRISCLSLFLYSYVVLYFIFYGFLSDREGVHLGASRWISHCRNPRSQQAVAVFFSRSLSPPSPYKYLTSTLCVKCDATVTGEKRGKKLRLASGRQKEADQQITRPRCDISSCVISFRFLCLPPPSCSNQQQKVRNRRHFKKGT